MVPFRKELEEITKRARKGFYNIDWEELKNNMIKRASEGYDFIILNTDLPLSPQLLIDLRANAIDLFIITNPGKGTQAALELNWKSLEVNPAI